MVSLQLPICRVWAVRSTPLSGEKSLLFPARNAPSLSELMTSPTTTPPKSPLFRSLQFLYVFFALQSSFSLLGQNVFADMLPTIPHQCCSGRIVLLTFFLQNLTPPQVIAHTCSNSEELAIVASLIRFASPSSKTSLLLAPSAPLLLRQPVTNGKAFFFACLCERFRSGFVVFWARSPFVPQTYTLPSGPPLSTSFFFVESQCRSVPFVTQWTTHRDRPSPGPGYASLHTAAFC